MKFPSTNREAWRRRALAADAGFAAIPDIIDRTGDGEGIFSTFSDRAKGPYVWTIDGERYLDLVLHYGSVVLGHADDEVDDMVIQELRRGSGRTLRPVLHTQLAELICELVPGAEQALIVRTGSDATSAAVRLARAHTGRERVVRWGYHGWHEWCAPRHAGIPREVVKLSGTFRYNDLDSVREALAAGPPPACLIMLPFELDMPEPGFLAECRRLAHEAGAVFIFDEVRTGFRVAAGGAQQLFGVEADLGVFGKALGNGYAVSAVAGRREILAQAARVSLNSLFFRNCDGPAAAIATLRRLRDTPALDHIAVLGRRLQEGLALAAADAGLDGVAQIGHPTMPYHRFGLSAEMETAVQRVFCAAAAERGVIFHPAQHWFLCASMTEDDIEHAVAAAAHGYTAVAALGESVVDLARTT